MLLGFDNDFILEKIFGDNDVFENAIVDNVNYYPLDFTMSMDILTECKVLNPPEQWTTFDIVWLKLDFFGIDEFKSEIVNRTLKLKSFYTTECQCVDGHINIYVVNILACNGSSISCKFKIGHVQKIIPMKYNNIGKF